jgi:competence protein ComGC
MKQTTKRELQAMTFIEVLVVIVVVLALAVLALPSLARAKAKANRISCISNLKELGTAYRLWEGDHGDLVPSQQSVKKGGWADFLTNANQGAICWTNYAILQNELGQAPKILICPADERSSAADFTNHFKDDTHVSYFVGVNASDTYPQAIMGGDRNLGPGTTPDPDYGFSPKSGKGNDVISPISSPVSWSLRIHSAGNPVGAGNILLGDGSGQQTSSSAYLNREWLPNAQGTNNWPASQVPATPSIRLVFP